MKKLVFFFFFTQIVLAQGGMFGKDPIINKENWNKHNSRKINVVKSMD